LRILSRRDPEAERKSKPPEAVLELETGDPQQLGRLPEVDPLIEVIADNPDLRKLFRLSCVSTGGANGEGSQEAIVESIQENDPVLPSADNDRKLIVLDPVQDLSGTFGKLGWGEGSLSHRNPSSREYAPLENATRGGRETRLPVRLAWISVRRLARQISSDANESEL
jgi:hypothetical protein